MEIHLKGTWSEIKAEISALIERGDETAPAPVKVVEAPLDTQLEQVEAVPVAALPPVADPTAAINPVAPVAPAIQAIVDSAGMPWNATIHASTKTTVKNGTWKLKRNVTPEQIAAAQGAAPVAPVAPAETAPTAAPVDLPALTQYIAKIATALDGNYKAIQDFLISISVPNVTAVPAEKLPELAEALRAQFNVEF